MKDWRISEVFTKEYLPRRRFAESTVDAKRRALTLFLQTCGNLDIRQVNYNVADDFRTLTVAGRLTQKGVNVYLAHLKAFFAWCLKHGHISVNPFAAIELYKVQRQICQVYQADELARLMQVADLRMKVVVLLGVCCGLRRTEIFNLTRSEIDFELERIHLQAKAKTKSTWAWSIKNQQESLKPLPRIVPVGGQEYRLHDLVRELIAQQAYPYVCIRPQDFETNILLDQQGKLNHHRRYLPWTTFNGFFTRLLRRAMVRHKKLHALRSTFATEMFRAGLQLDQVQKLMGHQSLSTTGHYYIAYDAQKALQSSREALSKCYNTNSVFCNTANVR